ncbi:hypothetical protein KSF73_03600 [Burkholderiaceae bacterium DAT-1]|nr:hypothetical protein [Burkholderiaceae bacterium DAT-1]
MRLGMIGLLWLLSSSVIAMDALDERSLSQVSGRDGISFDLSGFVYDSKGTYTYTNTTTGTQLVLGDLYAARSDNPDQFADPYALYTVKRGNGLADVTYLDFPKNVLGAEKWQIAFDWRTVDGAGAFNNGALVVHDLAMYGGGFQFSTPADGNGLSWGLGINLDIGSLMLRPNGRGDINNPADPAVTNQMVLHNIHVGAVDQYGNPINQAWQIADVDAQPGQFYVAGDGSLHLGIQAPVSGTAAAGTISVGNMSFANPNPASLHDLGASRIGSIQIQSLDIKFKQ